MKAIETEYAGCLFRSRLEARWAVVFDHLGIEWQYEPEGFELRGRWPEGGHSFYWGGKFDYGRYLPDFWLPSVGAWFEVKGERSTPQEQDKAIALAYITTSRVVIADQGVPRPGHAEGNEGMVMFDERGIDLDYKFCLCHQCGKVCLERNGYAERACGHGGVARRTADAPLVAAAYMAGRSARFEFGESGAVRR